MQSVAKMIIWTVLVSSLLLAEGFATNAMACNYYASPNGGGNGSSPSSPFKISNFWSVAGPGKTLCLLDGVYTGSSSIIKPPSGLKGTSSARITIKAVNDGAVRIDGQGVLAPIALNSDNDWFTIEGINAHNSGTNAVVQIAGGSDNNIIRRVVAWDCPLTSNCTVMSVNSGVNNLFEDVAAFGTGRKIFSSSQSGRSNFKIRRSWGAWTKTQSTNGPKMTYSLAYNSYDVLYENVIGTWHEEDLATNDPGNRYGIFAMDQMQSTDLCANSKYIGSIAYLRGADSKKDKLLGILRSGNGFDCLTFDHTVAYVEPSTHYAQNTASLLAGSNSASPQKFGKRNTWIGGDGTDSVSAEWTISNTENVSTVGAASNIWNGGGSTGARICKRYVNGVVTNEPLWPWPMDQRIKDALRASGRNPADYFRGTGNTVTSEMETIFGAIPTECKSTSSSTTTSNVTTQTAPAAPGNLVANP